MKNTGSPTSKPSAAAAMPGTDSGGKEAAALCGKEMAGQGGAVALVGCVTAYSDQLEANSIQMIPIRSLMEIQGPNLQCTK
jgi:hypothetical protein